MNRSEIISTLNKFYGGRFTTGNNSLTYLRRRLRNLRKRKATEKLRKRKVFLDGVKFAKKLVNNKLDNVYQPEIVYLMEQVDTMIYEYHRVLPASYLDTHQDFFTFKEGILMGLSECI